MKRILLTLLIALASLPRLSAAVGDEFEYDGLWYKVLDEDDLTAEVVWHVYVTGDIVIPSIVGYNGADYMVTSIGSSAFRNCSSLTSVNIPNSVASIGSSAFDSCISLTTVTIPNSVTLIDNEAFARCRSLTALTIPNSVTTIGELAFCGCGLTTVAIPESVTSIGNGAFLSCSNLTTVTIPPSVTYIDYSVFKYCSSLTTVDIPNSVTSIGNGAFMDCISLTTVTIPSSVTSIDDHAFSGCSSLTTVTIPSSVTLIDYGAFDSCSSLTEINVETGSEYFCSDKGILYNLDKTMLIQFPGGKAECDIPPSVTTIKAYAFSGCNNLTAVSIPETVTTIGFSAFSNCSNLTTVTIPPSVTSISSEVFKYCSSLTSVNIPNSVTYIGHSAFYGCSGLTTLTIPPSVTTIGSSAFQYCSSLTTVTIPNSVTLIGDEAFKACSSLTTVDIPNSVISIGSSAFFNCSNLTTVTIPNSVTSIGHSAFYGCSSLTTFTIPNSVTSISSCVFYDCISLTTVTIPESVTTIENYAFFGCSSLTTFTIPESVTTIEHYVFYGCSSLTTVTIPESVTSICNGTFGDCTNLIKIVNLNSTPQSTGYNTFSDVPTDAVVYIPKGSYAAYSKANGWGAFKIFREMDADITLSSTTIDLNKGESFEITASVKKYEDMTIQGDEWSSSNTDVATVNGGKVTAISPGTAVISYTVVDEYGVEFTATCSVKVKTVLAESITLDKTELTLTIGTSAKLTATVLPEDVTDKTIIWSTSDGSIATVDTEGNVTAIALGEVTISATCGDKSATCKVTVNPIFAESITLNKTELTLTIGASEKLTATVLPEDVTDKTIIWSTSDESIATVDTEGNVTAIALGEATITATCGDKSATCKITVNPIFAESITLNKTELTLTIGATDKLTATILPEDVTDKTIIWSTSDESIATVDSDGNVTAASIGEAAITATCGETSATCLVFVENTSGLVAVATDGVNIIVNGSMLTITGVNSDDKVTIARQDGAVIYSGNNRESYTLVRGLYLVIVNGATYKVVIH